MNKDNDFIDIYRKFERYDGWHHGLVRRDCLLAHLLQHFADEYEDYPGREYMVAGLLIQRAAKR